MIATGSRLVSYRLRPPPCVCLSIYNYIFLLHAFIMEVRIKKPLKSSYEIFYGKTVAFEVFIMPSVRPRPEHVSLNVPGICYSLLYSFLVGAGSWADVRSCGPTGFLSNRTGLLGSMKWEVKLPSFMQGDVIS